MGGGTRSASGSSGGGVSKKSSPETGVPYTGHNYDHNATYASIREMYADMHYHPDFPTPPLDPVYPFLGQLVYLYGVYMHSFHMRVWCIYTRCMCIYCIYTSYVLRSTILHIPVIHNSIFVYIGEHPSLASFEQFHTSLHHNQQQQQQQQRGGMVCLYVCTIVL